MNIWKSIMRSLRSGLPPARFGLFVGSVFGLWNFLWTKFFPLEETIGISGVSLAG